MAEDHEEKMDDMVAATLELLETRLRAIEYALHGHRDPGAPHEGRDKSAATRLKELEAGLVHFTQKTQVIQDLLQLRELGSSSSSLILSNKLIRCALP